MLLIARLHVDELAWQELSGKFMGDELHFARRSNFEPSPKPEGSLPSAW